MTITRLALAIAGTCLPALAQESFWIANRASNDIMRVSSWGSVLERVATPTALRGSTTAPDGKVWIVRFIQATVDIYDPATTTFTPVTLPSGTAFQIAFDAAGHAFISNSASAVHEYDAAGTFVQTHTLSAGAALGITVDAQGNKWVAHRVSPASVSRIEPNGTVTNFPIVGATMQPTAIMADYRGILQPSHIWVVGDGTPQLAELDSAGATLAVYLLPAASAGSLTFDRNGDIWVGHFNASGTLHHVDETSGAILATYTLPPSINGLATDTHGRILATVRVTFSGVGPPCELRRVDPATGTIEIPTQLQLGGFAASGTQAAVSTSWQYGLVVAPVGDMDGDGESNVSEILNGTSPTDATASSTFRLESFGSTLNGSTPAFEVQSTLLWVVGFSLGLVPPTPLPGFGGSLRLDLTTLVTTAAGLGNGSIPIAIPANPALAGFEFFAQGVVWTGSTFDFRNVSGMRVW
jgi:streptogramin lyase